MASKQLLSHIPKDQKEEFHNRLLANIDLFEQPLNILTKKIKDARTKQLSDTSYDTPAWSERQADLNGYQRALEEIKLLLTIER